jgi:large subunit ribosomal protein L21
VYAVIRTGGKQYKVKVGDVIDVERIAGDDGASLELVPLLVVDDEGKVSAKPAELNGAKVTASVVGQHRGKKVLVFTYKNKSGQRTHQGHRQSLTRLKVEGIDLPGRSKARTTRAAKDKDTTTKADAGTKTEASGAKAEASGAKAPAKARAAGAKEAESKATEPKATESKAAESKASGTKPAPKASGTRGTAKAKAGDTKDAESKGSGRSSRARAKQQDQEN